MSTLSRDEILAVVVRHFRSTLTGVDPASLNVTRPMVDFGVSSLETAEALTAAMRELRIRVPLAELAPDMNLEALATLFFLETKQGAAAKPTAGSTLDARAALLARSGEVEARGPRWDELTYDQFLGSSTAALTEMERFGQWRKALIAEGRYAFEAPHLSPQTPQVRLRRDGAGELELLNFSSYNYLGYGTHPEVIQAAKEALDTYGLGAASSPVISGTLGVHEKLEQELARFFGLPGRAVSLFSSGYGVNLGAISAFLKPGHYAVCDRSAHMFDLC